LTKKQGQKRKNVKAGRRGKKNDVLMKAGERKNKEKMRR